MKKAILASFLLFCSTVAYAGVGHSTVWRIRPAGNDNNGAGYDSTIQNAGTDYSQQDAPQYTYSDLSCLSTTDTIRSSSGGFVSEMIGNYIRILGPGTTGYYALQVTTDTHLFHLDRTCGTGSNITGRIGGAALTYSRLLNSGNNAGDMIVSGNTVYIRGSGLDNPGTTDYADVTGAINVVPGDTTFGQVSIVGENGRPYFRSNGWMFASGIYTRFENLYLGATANTSAANGIISFSSPGLIKNVKINTNNQATLVGVLLQGTLIDSEVTSGTTSPTSSVGAYLVQVGANGTSIINSFIHHGRYYGVYGTNQSGTVIQGCIISSNVSSGFYSNGAQNSNSMEFDTFDANGSDGITLAGGNDIAALNIRNCIFYKNRGYGINAVSNTSVVNDSLKKMNDYNDYYSNTSGPYNNVSAGAHDLTLDPQFVLDGSNWAIGTNLKAKGFPSTIRGTSTPTYIDIGAAQRQEPASVGTSMKIYVGQ